MAAMKRVLSFLLLIPFFVTQAWAIRGGPYDSPFGYSQAPLSGTYGVSLDRSLDPVVDLSNPASVAAGRLPENDPLSSLLSTTGVMTISVPTSGLTQARVLVFERGLFYFGSAHGRLDFRTGQMRLLAQLSHYLTADVLDITGLSGSFLIVDYMLSGQIDLQLSMDYFSGIIQVDGSAVLALTNLPLGFNENTPDLPGTKTTQITTTLSDTVPNFSINGGTLQTTTNSTQQTVDYHPEAFDDSRKPTMVIYLSANGVREDSVPITLPTFEAPTQETAFQFGVTLPDTAAGN